MAIPNPTHCGLRGPGRPTGEDRKVERAVLSSLLGEYPARFTVVEISRAMDDGGADFGAEDAVERAIRGLVGAGLLECEGGFVVPTRAALYFDALEVD